ncbi:hypothetical protein MTR72_39565 [Bradyrhizobium sp. ISRA442]|uniref:hypothetical protein n=1 Tax=Bradyrhizobium sp. ISRA442 TaxID=2866197 RepID=UPI00311AD010
MDLIGMVGIFGAAASELSIEHVAEIYSRGERRKLALANFAIAAIEREDQAGRGALQSLQNFHFRTVD